MWFYSQDTFHYYIWHLTEEPEVQGLIPGLAHTSVENSEIDRGIFSMVISPLPLDSRRSLVSYWRKYGHLVLVNRLGGPGIVWFGLLTVPTCP